MHLRAGFRSLFGILATALGAACNGSDSTSSASRTPTHIIIVSGTNQSGNVSAPLGSPLVVEVLDDQNKPVSNVTLVWTVVGGGSLSATNTTTGTNGESTVTWTLAAATGTQVVTVASGQIGSGSVSFVATNGPTITGLVTTGATNLFGPTFSRSVRSLSLGVPASKARHLSSNRIVVGFKGGMLGVASGGSPTYRSMSTARITATMLRSRVATITSAQPVMNVEVSPAMLALRMEVQDTTQIAAVLATLRADSSVAWAEREGVISIRDGAPHPMSDVFAAQVGASQTTGRGTANAATVLPSDPFFYQQLWPASMTDLPRAWAITTGSPSVVVASVDMGIRFDDRNIAANLTTDGYDFVSQTPYGSTETICATGTAPASTFTTIDGDGDGPDPDPTDPDDLVFDSDQGCWTHNDLGDHGLWTAGIIGAVGNQGLGVAGVNWNVKIRPVRVLGITGDGFDFDIAQGVLYAAGLPAVGANGALVQTTRAPIINLSLGGPDDDSTLSSAIAAAVGAGSLVVASAGNDGLDLPTYPASYPGVMAVSAVGMDGALATYSNAGTFISVAAPGGDFRLDDNGGGGVLGPGWDFQTGKATYLFGYGTSASAPFVSGIAALLLAQNSTLTAAQLRSRIEQYATRVTGVSRSDSFGWGIVDAYDALTQQNGPPHSTIARLVNTATGVLARTTPVNADGSFAFTQVAAGSYYVQAGADESGDAMIGIPGRLFATAGGIGAPTVITVNTSGGSVPIALGLPPEVEPNDDMAHANVLTVGSYVIGSITPPDAQDVYSVLIPTAGLYTFETSGVVGSCGMGIELDTHLTVASAAGAAVASNDDTPSSATGPYCARIQITLTPGTYYVTVAPSTANDLDTHGRYRLQVRSGT